MAIIEALGVTKTVSVSESSLTILQGIDLSINRGESVAIIGSSGSGKSTLLGILAGLDVPSSGRVVLDGEELTALNEDQRAAIRGRSVGFVFQSFHLLSSLTALENVMLPLELQGDSDARSKADNFLARVGLAHRLDHYPKQLSGGEQQRVAIARAFAIQPAVLFADEPTGNLDVTTGAQVIDLLFELNREQGTTLVLVTHENRLAERCQRVVCLVDGQIEEPSAKDEPSANTRFGGGTKC